MAINLSGKADASIVSAAKAAGDALKGPDYSKTFQGMATAYAGAMDKMGAGLAEVAKVGTMAAGALVKDLKTAKGELGEGLYSKVMGDLKGLIKDRLDIFKMPDGSEEKAEAKEEFKRNKKIRFQEFRDLRDGTLANNLNIETGNINEEYLREHPEYSMMLQANALYGEPIKEGPFAGVKVDYVRDAEGNLQLQYTGPDGKPVVGLKDDGSPIYKGDEVKAPTGVEDKTQILRKTKTNQKIRAYLPLEEGGLDRLANEGYTRYKVGKDGLLTDEIAFESKGPAALRTTQMFLNEMGYTDADGEPLEADGKLGPKTRYAFEQFRKDQEARKQAAGGLFSDIMSQGADPLTLNPTELPGLLTTKELVTRANLNQLGLDAMANGQKGFKFRENETRNSIVELIDNDNKFNDVTHARIGDSELSYADALGSKNNFTAEMWTSITSIAAGMQGATDVTGDGVINEDDFTDSDANNMMVLRKAMLNPKNYEAKQIFADWYTNEVKSYHAEGLARYNKSIQPEGAEKNDLGLNRTRTYFTINYTGEGDQKVAKYVTGEDIDNESMLFKSIEDQGKGGWTAYNGANYRFDDGQWYKVGRDKDGDLLDEIKVPRNTVLNDLGWNTYPSVMKRIGVTPVKKEPDFIFGGSNLGPLSQYKKNKDGNYTVNGQVVLFKKGDTYQGKKSKESDEATTSAALVKALLEYEKNKYK